MVALKGIVQLERSRVDSLTQELHTARKECDKWNKEAMSWKSRSEECSIRLEENSRRYDAAQETLQAQKEELMLLKHDSQNSRQSMESVRREMQQKSEKISTLEKEVLSLKEEISMLRSLTEGVEGTSRDNERLKSALANAQHEMSVQQLKHDHVASTNMSLRSDLEKRDKRIQEMEEEASERSERLDSLSNDLNTCRVALSDEKSRSIALEAALKEHRVMSTNLQSELDNIKVQKLNEERRYSEEGSRLMHARSDFGKTCSVILHALLKWDRVLVLAMESFDIHDRESNDSGYLSLSRNSGGGSSRSSSGAMSIWWNDSSPRSGNDTMMLVEEMMERPDELLQSSVAIVERIQVKVERLMKIRRLFEMKTTQLISVVESKFKHGQDTIELLSHKIGTMQHLVRNAEDIVLKEKKARDESNSSMRSFQESIVSGHTKQIRDLEEKCTEGALALQDSQHKVRSLEHEVHVLREEVSILTEEKDRLTDAEEVIEKLTAKFDDVAQSNQLMSHEIDDRGAQISDLKKRIREVTNDNDRLSAAATALKDQIELRDKVLNEQEAQLSGLRAEVNYLKQYQIDPKLEKSIIESQDVLRASLATRHDGAEHRLRDDRSATVLQRVLSNISTLMDSAVRLVRDTQEMLQDFEDNHKSSALDLGTRHGLLVSSMRSGGTDAVDQNVLDLLNANAKLAVQLQHAINDIKKLSATAPFHGSSGQPHTLSRTVALPESRDHREMDVRPYANRSPANGSGGLSLDMLSSSRGVQRDHTASFSSDGVDLNYSSKNYRSHRVNEDEADDSRHHPSNSRSGKVSREFGYYGVDGAPPREEPIHPPASSQRYRPSTSSFSQSTSGYTPSEHHRPSTSNVTERDKYSYQETTGSYKRSDYRNTSSSSAAGGYRLSNSAVQLAQQRTPSPSSKSRKDYRASSGGVNTVARESAGRLSKLGNDLQSLAAKLDSFDVRHTTR